MRRISCLSGCLLLVVLATPLRAGHPLLSYWARQSTGPYAPQVGRYAVVDPVATATVPTDHHGRVVGAPQELWQRRDSAPRVYPYGWFGTAPHATNSWAHTRYYDNYTDFRISRGR